MSESRAIRRPRLRRVGMISAAAGLLAGSAMTVIGLGAAPAAATTGTTLSINNLPSSLGNGGDLQAFSATIDNTNGSDDPNSRVDLTIEPHSGTRALSPSDVVLKYQCMGGSAAGCDNDPNGFTTIPLSADQHGGLSGFFGPTGGFDVPAGASTTTNLEVTTNPTAPVGAATVNASLDTVDSSGTKAATVATAASHNVAFEVPSLTAHGVPTSLEPGAAPTPFTGTLSNSTGSNYGGATSTNSPSPAGVRLDFTITNSGRSLSPGDLTLQYCTDAARTSCQTIPLSSNGSGGLTGDFGPTGGFSLPNGANTTTNFQIQATSTAPTTGSYTTSIALDKVDPASGSTTGTDTTGVANGTIRAVTVAPTPPSSGSTGHHKRAEHPRESLSSHHSGKLRVHVSTHPRRRHTKVRFYVVRHGHRHPIGTGHTNSHGVINRTFHEKSGRVYRIVVKVFASSTFKVSYTTTHRIRVHG